MLIYYVNPYSNNLDTLVLTTKQASGPLFDREQESRPIDLSD